MPWRAFRAVVQSSPAPGRLPRCRIAVCTLVREDLPNVPLRGVAVPAAPLVGRPAILSPRHWFNVNPHAPLPATARSGKWRAVGGCTREWTTRTFRGGWCGRACGRDSPRQCRASIGECAHTCSHPHSPRFARACVVGQRVLAVPLRLWLRLRVRLPLQLQQESIRLRAPVCALISPHTCTPLHTNTHTHTHSHASAAGRWRSGVGPPTPPPAPPPPSWSPA